MTDQCVWCKIHIADESGDKVWIERQKVSATEYEWQAVFCGDEHASMWVAKPFDPDPASELTDSWQDMAFAIGCLSALALLGLFTAIGFVNSLDWVFDKV